MQKVPGVASSEFLIGKPFFVDHNHLKQICGEIMKGSQILWSFYGYLI